VPARQVGSRRRPARQRHKASPCATRPRQTGSVLPIRRRGPTRQTAAPVVTPPSDQSETRSPTWPSNAAPTGARQLWGARRTALVVPPVRASETGRACSIRGCC
jgi:hypothetical protein